MADSVYKVIELVGTSTESWEKAATVAVERAAQSLRGRHIPIAFHWAGDSCVPPVWRVADRIFVHRSMRLVQRADYPL